MTRGVRFDLLDEALIHMRGVDGRVAPYSLPAVLGALAGGHVFGDFPALQAHQRHPWYAFLVQVAAIAMHRAGLDAPPTDPDTWRSLLLALSDTRREPWCLVVDDPAHPALLQAAAPDVAGFKSVLGHPDELDILITSKNHDVKALRIDAPAPEHWLFALIALQTMQGYPGRGYYGIARMNGGSGNRPAVGHQPSLGWGARFRRDVAGLLAARSTLADTYGYRADGGVELLWLPPWDRETPLSLGELGPLFVEICQAVRLEWRGDRIVARKTTQGAARVDAKAQSGRTGDPWTPIDVVDEKSLTLAGSGFTYSKIVDLLDAGRYQPGPLGERLPGDPDGTWFSAWALVRGQGKTEGMHERRIAVPGPLRGLFADPDARGRLITFARERVEEAGKVRKTILGPALGRLRGDAGDSKSQVIARFTGQRLARFEDRVDDLFFPALWDDAARHLGDLTPWRETLVRLAEQVLKEALDAAPLPAARRYRAIAAAEGRFYSAVRTFCPSALRRAGASDDEEVAVDG